MIKKSTEEPEVVDTPEETTQTRYDESWKKWRKYKHHHYGSNGGLILILIGIIFLLNNFGLLSSDIWNMLWRFWPVFLIVFGLQMISGRSRVTSFILTLLGMIIILAVFAFAIAQVNPAFSHWLNVQLPFLHSLSASY